MRTLTRYIGRDVLFATMLLFVALIGLFTFFDLIAEMRDVGRGSYTLTTAFLYVALHIPSRIYELFPVAALIGTLFAISQLVANSEFTVMRASGASILQVGWAVVRVGIPLAIATFLAGEYVAPPAERLAQTVRAAAMGNATGVVAQQFESGFWFKQDLTFVNIRTVLSDMTLVGVRIYEFDRDLRLTAVRSAETGRFAGQGRWNLEQVKVTELGRDSATVSSAPSWMWQTVLQPSILTVYQVAPERLALSTLYDNIRVLGTNAQKTSRFEIALWSKVLYPVAVIVMMMLALPFAQFQRRQGGRRVPDLRRHDAGALVLADRAPVLIPWRAERLGAVLLRGISADRVHQRRDRHAVLHRAQIAKARQAPGFGSKLFCASGRLRLARHHVGELVLLRALGAELHVAVDQREQREILAHADVHAGMNHRTALADDDAAGADGLAAVHLGPQPLRMGIAAVARTAACFFVCHDPFLCRRINRRSLRS